MTKLWGYKCKVATVSSCIRPWMTRGTLSSWIPAWACALQSISVPDDVFVSRLCVFCLLEGSIILYQVLCGKQFKAIHCSVFVLVYTSLGIILLTYWLISSVHVLHRPLISSTELFLCVKCSITQVPYLCCTFLKTRYDTHIQVRNIWKRKKGLTTTSIFLLRLSCSHLLLKIKKNKKNLFSDHLGF